MTGLRCTERKHVQERGKTFCDCGAVIEHAIAVARGIPIRPVGEWLTGERG